MSDYMTVAEAQARLKEHGIVVTQTGMYKLVKQGRLPHVRLNRLYITGLDAFLASQAEASTQPASHRVPPAETTPVRVEPALRLEMPKVRRFGTPQRDRRSA